ncbi:helix-turn-helix domain-containing protein [Paenibacillus silagei]|uniref:Antitoxin component HigA of HigAB toxin-antitoxin module n=1 Tax=Paenibacillus silagei TaxID=1670801 RepID=A0ABS4NJ45_9BACL|nr:helix-turn-helix transcriptional regulator [Paenibacillus silagei]MBP2110038.1 antitoxin component HigA of HigAB toxin-antitoxin module [Paenibacillus silagei]
MEHTVKIRDEIAAYLTKHKLSINQFAIASGIHSGTLSRVMKGQQALAMNHLTRVTSGMGLPEDYFYSQYVDECLYDSTPTWRRLRPFLLQCAALSRLDCIERVAQNLLDNLLYAPLLFEVAEELFEQKNWQAAALIYENVGASEKYQHSERLALCQYRLFLINLGDDPQKNLIAATILENYVDKLDEVNQLDALKQLANLYSGLQAWDKVSQSVEELLRVATVQYELHGQVHRKHSSNQFYKKPLYTYILYAQLMRSCVYEELGDYKTALDMVPQYMDHSWIREDDEEARRIKAQYIEWGTANTYLYRLMDGQIEVLEEYIEYISTCENEIFMALFKIVQLANQYKWDVDHVIQRFADYIPYRKVYSIFGEHNKFIHEKNYTQFCSELATYYLSRKRYKGDDVIMQSVDLSAKLDSEQQVIRGTISVDFEIAISDIPKSG